MLVQFFIWLRLRQAKGSALALTPGQRGVQAWWKEALNDMFLPRLRRPWNPPQLQVIRQ